jgi:hypothetical protein
MPRRARDAETIVVCAALIGVPLASRAAGGHHAVEDAALLDPGQCQVEAWYERERAGARTVLHAGPACRLGAVELGVDVNRVRAEGDGTASVAAAQLKWARAVGAGWSSGVVLGAFAHDGSPRFLGSAILVPVTWQAANVLLVHAQVGRDFRHAQGDSPRAGISVEWTPSPAWSLMAERFAEGGADLWRAGARWAITPNVYVDLSRARVLGGAPSPWWTLGLGIVFER